MDQVPGLQRTTHTTTLNQFMFTSLDLKLLFKPLSPTDNDAKFNIKKHKTQPKLVNKPKW